MKIDDGKYKFVILKGLPCKTGAYFQKCLNDQKAASGIVELDDVSFEVLYLFNQWLHTGSLAEKHHLESDYILDRGGPITILVNLALFGDRIQCARLINHCLDLLADFEFDEVHLSDVANVWEQTAGAHPLRDYMCVHVASTFKDDRSDLDLSVLRGHESFLGQDGDFLRDVTKQSSILFDKKLPTFVKSGVYYVD